MDITPAPQFDEAAEPAPSGSAQRLASWGDRFEAAERPQGDALHDKMLRTRVVMV
jgi:hypothetical protein